MDDDISDFTFDGYADYHIAGDVFFTEDEVRDCVEDAMAELNMSLTDLSMESGVSDSTLRRWLNGKGTIKYNTLESIFIVLDEENKNRKK